jgi:adenine-specific DNA-methyltransferase
VRVNDTLSAAVALSSARVTGVRDAQFPQLGGYARAVRALNAAEPRQGFIFREYSPGSLAGGPIRKYFTPENAGRIDGIRAQIEEWDLDGRISPVEKRLLIGDLLEAANAVANTAGTYGCFLASFSSTASRPLSLRPRMLLRGVHALDAHDGDVTEVPVDVDDVVYYDPPYTKRQYAAYYHILETIALGDEPAIEGKTGLRPWREKASDYCYKTRALTALAQLILNTSARAVFLSYSTDGHASLTDLQELLVGRGEVELTAVEDVARYRPNAAARSGTPTVTEYLLRFTPRSSALDQVA